MQRIKDVRIEYIRCDIEPRVNQDKGVLWKQLQEYGQIDPIMVEGPTETGHYYIIDGERRFRMLKELKSKTVTCEISRDITSTVERNRTRLILQTSNKRPTRGEQVLLYEKSSLDPKLLSLLPKYTQKNMKRSIQVPSNIRRQAEKSRSSQEALNLIWIDLDVTEGYRDELITRLCNREIGSSHADALKKLVRCPKYEKLNQDQRIYAIEAVIGNAKFTDHDADQIVIEAMMQCNPNSHYTGYWVSYISHQMDDIRNKLNVDIANHTPSNVKKVLLSSLQLLSDTCTHLFGDADPTTETVENQEAPLNTIQTQPKLRLIEAARDMRGITFETSGKVVKPRFVPFDGGIRVVFPEA